MRLRDLAIDPPGPSFRSAVWAQRIEGKFTMDSPCRYGWVGFENGGLLDGKEFFGMTVWISEYIYQYTGDDEFFNEPAVEAMIEEVNELL